MTLPLLLAGAATALALALPAEAQTLTIATAGDANMVEYIDEFLAPRFEALHPGVTVRALGTGPGDGGSQAIWERLVAQAGAERVDVDVAVVHQRMAGQMVREELLTAYRDAIETGGLVTRDTAEVALGVDVGGYVMPMFHSQIAIAYNPDLVPQPPQTYEELAAWAEANPGLFGYNGITGGMSGVGFVFGWLYAFTEVADEIKNAPLGEEGVQAITPALEKLAAFNGHVTKTPGNAGTLDALNRGEIAMGPVWMDMFYTWVADGRLNPDLRLLVLGPGMPGQPMYYVVPNGAPNEELARAFVSFATSPEVQAEGIVRRFNWFPGIDPQHVRPILSDDEWQRLFADVSPEILAERGWSMPQADNFRLILETYERVVR
ncbi:extracellular solute-binding protein [Salinarimonas sp.]|uniref:extracellular solute-binding protein n=1 Tax=Salinarimonas sp. TaxID=2766526 RepID=UPI00391DC447